MIVSQRRQCEHSAFYPSDREFGELVRAALEPRDLAQMELTVKCVCGAVLALHDDAGYQPNNCPIFRYSSDQEEHR